MNVIIIANFPYRLDGAKEKGRFLYLGEMLCNLGHNVEMIVSDFDHGKKKHRERGSIIQSAYKTLITELHEPGYPNNISVKRLWSHYQWGRNVGRYLAKVDRPDVVYCAVPSLTAGVRAAKYCKNNGIKFIIDVQDLWPEAFMMAIQNKVFQLAFKPIEWYANKIYKSADYIVAVSETYVQRALRVNKIINNGLSVFLGNDGALFDESRNSGKEEQINDGLQLAYIGTLGHSYDLKCVIDALSLYKQRGNRINIRFIVMGDGPLKEEFERYSKEKDVCCVFTGALTYQEMVARMCDCDIVVNPIIEGSAASIINKVGDYALSGLPVINTQESPEYRQLVDQYHCGINCRAGNAEDVANALEKLSSSKELRVMMGEGARRLGEDKFDREKTYTAIVSTIENTPPPFNTDIMLHRNIGL